MIRNDDNEQGPVVGEGGDNSDQRRVEEERMIRRQRRRMVRYIWLGVFAGLALFLQLTVWTLELQIHEMKLRNGSNNKRGRGARSSRRPSDADDDDTLIDDDDDNLYDDDDDDDDDDDGDAVDDGKGSLPSTVKQHPSISTASGTAASNDKAKRKESEKTESRRTIKHSLPAQLGDLHVYRLQGTADIGGTVVTSADAYWNQAVHLLGLNEWDPTIEAQSALPVSTHGRIAAEFQAQQRQQQQEEQSAQSTDSSSSTTVEAANALATLGVEALQRAADLGHPDAQHLVANAYAAGFWPTAGGVVQHASSSSSARALQVQDTLLETGMNHAQQTKAWLYWHMAALSGHVEAAMAMAYRVERRQQLAGARSLRSSKSAGGAADAARATSKDFASIAGVSAVHKQEKARTVEQCWERLPYYEAAASGIMDQLEADPQSRAKVLPAPDRHLLYQVHLHGGQGSRLEHHNKPDETAEALQFYHVRAVAKDSTSASQSAHAAYTLATLYHYGLRGVVQNLTLAVQYYEMAAIQGHWEAAGYAGMLNLWGMGVKQDPHQAHKMFRIGMPFQLQGCLSRFNQKLRQSKNDDEDIYICDDNCLNGMGVLRLLGIPLIVTRDEEQAKQLFHLAKEQGNVDAAYNLAMMKLGWKTHYQSIHSLDDRGQTMAHEEFPWTAAAGGGSSAGMNGKKAAASLPQNHPSQAEYQSILSDLATAAGKNHLQARHRLALMYSKGIKFLGKPGQQRSIADSDKDNRDCEKAVKHYKWIVDHASPQRTARLRKAYKQYTAGEMTHSVRNYLAAAEAGSQVGALNAAFLLEQGLLEQRQGNCLGMGRIDCAKASVRLWKAVAESGDAEASLRVGDFYYYGRFRESKGGAASEAQLGVVGPFGWAQYLLYPERFLLPLLWQVTERLIRKVSGALFASKGKASSSQDMDESIKPMAGETCRSDLAGKGGVGGACLVGDASETSHQLPPLGSEGDDNRDGSQGDDDDDDDDEHSIEKDLSMAAQYYLKAAEGSGGSPRGHFNLGFMFEWGLGLKQDFHLAKRHYDLAVSSGSSGGEAEVPVAIALVTMKLHESLVKKWIAFQEQWAPSPASSDDDDNAETGQEVEESSSDSESKVGIPSIAKDKNEAGGEPVPLKKEMSVESSETGTSDAGGDKEEEEKKTNMDVFLSHLCTWESLLILFLTIALSILLQQRQPTREQRQQ